ncbi:YdcF family protein [Corynebacterium aquatimens]|uniref:Uncharacterized SAM-binding protein YcdF (DUF218 family) n=1 Tax=Corynebacterium aquatimens TaxID=1190508 RepID=A0A931GUU6_9CORY|nr:YdcF family protein [Corynebacterium aquatimens]MBG6123135.1 uncharacterized SAM-binding protein YcdF (DUF218 family) [Corynebacterium aquatimens]WJY66533.1 hypothetical protein CAQUA_09230 [Corynebacterium aquatimens]
MIPLVVLGARVRDGQPSKMLEARLRTARDVLSVSGRRPVVVTGRGEADVMAAWLVAHGVDEKDIIIEPWATSTNENLENSWGLFARAVGSPVEQLEVVTNGFHAARTRVWAWHLGVPITVTSAPTPRRSRAKNYAREVIATPHSLARVVWRKVMRRLRCHA